MGRHEGTDEFPGLEAHASSIHLRWIVNLYTCLVQDPHSRTHIETKPGDNTLSDANTVTSGLMAAQGRNIALNKPGLIRVRPHDYFSLAKYSNSWQTARKGPETLSTSSR